MQCLHPAPVRKQALSFPTKLTIKSREWREMAQKSHCCQALCFSSPQDWLPARLSPARPQAWGIQAFARVLCPQHHRCSQASQHSLFPHLREVETPTFPQKKDSVSMKHCFPGLCGNNPDPFSVQLKY